MEWGRGTTLSAIGHAGLILWVALGDWLEDYRLSELYDKNLLGGRP